MRYCALSRFITLCYTLVILRIYCVLTTHIAHISVCACVRVYFSIYAVVCMYVLLLCGNW